MKLGSLIPCPGSFAKTVFPKRDAISARFSSSLPSDSRSTNLKSISLVANRHDRNWPSEVRRKRSQDPQNGRVTLAIIPTVSGPPLIRNSSAGAEPRASTGVSEV
jgi:hypothetical protein